MTTPTTPTTTATADGVRAEDVRVPMTEQARDEARLSFDNGVERLELRGAADPASLLTAEFGDPLPLTWVHGSNVHVEYPLGSRLLRRASPNTITINRSVPWAFDVHGGAARVDALLADVDVRSMAFHSGAAHVRLVLGHPDAARTIRLAAVKDLRIERPADVPIRLELMKGAVKITVDDRWIGAVGGGLTEHTSGYDPDRPHYLVTVAGGADTVTVDKAVEGGH